MSRSRPGLMSSMPFAQKSVTRFQAMTVPGLEFPTPMPTKKPQAMSVSGPRPPRWLARMLVSGASATQTRPPTEAHGPSVVSEDFEPLDERAGRRRRQ